MASLEKLVNELGLDAKSCRDKLEEVEVDGGYVGDLLSDVIANAQKDNLWVTIQIHPNIVGVAVLKELSGIVIAGGRQPDKETVDRASEQGVIILTSDLQSFELVGRLCSYGI
jgi:hypothetical protein